MKHVVMYSGGGGSRNAARRVKAAYGSADLILLFTDTLIEDKDTYRYMVESAAHLYDLPKPYHLIAFCDQITDIKTDADIEKRKIILAELARKTTKLIPQFVWIQQNETPWETFKRNRFLGNSRTAHCSKNLKQEPAQIWIEANYKPDECIIYVGIDWTEVHRFIGTDKKLGIRKHYLPYTAKAPMTEAPYHDKHTMHQIDAKDGIKMQRMYEQGFAHANCGGFCVRGGQGHFINLLQNNRDYYLFNESKELEMQEFLGREDVTILTRTVEGQEERLTLQKLREEWDSGLGLQVDLYDIGGCGCFAQYDESA